MYGVQCYRSHCLSRVSVRHWNPGYEGSQWHQGLRVSRGLWVTEVNMWQHCPRSPGGARYWGVWVQWMPGAQAYRPEGQSNRDLGCQRLGWQGSKESEGSIVLFLNLLFFFTYVYIILFPHLLVLFSHVFPLFYCFIFTPIILLLDIFLPFMIFKFITKTCVTSEMDKNPHKIDPFKMQYHSTLWHHNVMRHDDVMTQQLTRPVVAFHDIVDIKWGLWRNVVL